MTSEEILRIVERKRQVASILANPSAMKQTVESQSYHRGRLRVLEEILEEVARKDEQRELELSLVHPALRK